MRLSWPSPLPIFCSTGRFAVGTVSPDVAPLEAEPFGAELVLELLQPASNASAPTSDRAPAARQRVLMRLCICALPFRASQLLVRVIHLRDGDGLIGQPGDSGRCLANIVSCRRSLLVLPGDHEFASGIKIDDVTGQHPDIDDIPDPPGLYACARWGFLTLRQESDLL